MSPFCWAVRPTPRAVVAARPTLPTLAFLRPKSAPSSAAPAETVEEPAEEPAEEVVEEPMEEPMEVESKVSGDMTFMVQREVAERLTAESTRDRLTAAAFVFEDGARPVFFSCR